VARTVVTSVAEEVQKRIAEVVEKAEDDAIRSTSHFLVAGCEHRIRKFNRFTVNYRKN
jgi:hypothetical protein